MLEIDPLEPDVVPVNPVDPEPPVQPTRPEIDPAKPDVDPTDSVNTNGGPEPPGSGKPTSDLGFQSEVTICGSCGEEVETVTENVMGKTSWLLVCLLCVLACGVGGLIPCCWGGSKDVRHFCPKCGGEIVKTARKPRDLNK